jgi:putative endonuclease
LRVSLPITAVGNWSIYEHCTNVLDAIAREKQLKKWSRSKKVALIATMNPRWNDFASEVLGE